MFSFNPPQWHWNKPPRKAVMRKIWDKKKKKPVCCFSLTLLYIIIWSTQTQFAWQQTFRSEPAPVAQWLARRTVGRKVWGSNPIRVMWDFSALAGSYPELGVLWAQWEGWNHTAELHPLNGCVFEGVALITWPTLQVPQFPGLVNTGIIMTVSVVCGPVK